MYHSITDESIVLVRKDGVTSNINRRGDIIIFKCTRSDTGCDVTAIFSDEIWSYSFTRKHSSVNMTVSTMLMFFYAV